MATPMDESPSPGRQSATGSPVLAVPARNAFRSADDQPQQDDRTSATQTFKKSEVDVSPDGKESSTAAEASASNDQSREGFSRTANDISKMEETFNISGDCSTCGHAGFQAELFICVKCCTRRQHTYCSNSYHPRKRWFLRLCNWCEAEATELSISGASKQALSKRDTWAGARLEKSNAVDCLLGAALRLPTAGFSCVEDLLQVDSNVSSSAKRRKPPSFDSVEKARRSGLCGDMHTVKSLKRLGAASHAKSEGCLGSIGETQRSPSSSVENGSGRSPSVGSALTWRVKNSVACVDSEAATPTSSVTVSAHGSRVQRSDIRQRVEVGNLDTCAGRASSCDSSEKHDRNNGNISTSHVAALACEKANARLSPSVSKGRIHSSRSLKSHVVTIAQRSVQEERTTAGASSADYDARMKRSSGAGPVEHVQRATRTGANSRGESKENISKNTKPSSSSRSRENGSSSDSPEHKRIRLENSDKQKKTMLGSLLEKSCTDRMIVHESEDGITSSKGCVGVGLDCTNVPHEQQRPQVLKFTACSKDSTPSPEKSSNNGTSAIGLKQQPQQAVTVARQAMRPSLATGKSAGGSPTSRNNGNAEEKTPQKRGANQKDSVTKVRRTSSKMPGFHNNYKSLSDILC